MQNCEVCGNQYDKCFEVTMQGKKHTLDCFECAIALLAPECDHCHCKIIGHGVEQKDKMFCCAHCAKEEGPTTLKDRSH